MLSRVVIHAELKDTTFVLDKFRLAKLAKDIEELFPGECKVKFFLYSVVNLLGM